MNINTILELLNWTRIAPDQDQLLFDNCNDALRFSYFYGEKFFNQLRIKIIDALNQKNKTFVPKTYMDFHLWFLVTIGSLIPRGQTTAEGYLKEFAETDTSQATRALSAVTLGPLSYVLMKINGGIKDDGRVRESRLAVCIPSGEGKTWLAQKYPELFVDHDSLTLPKLEEKYVDSGNIQKWLAVGNEMLNPQQYDTPPQDKRILLTHHPNTTNRTIWRQYVLPYPNFNRNNLLNRLMLDDPITRSQAERNEELLAFARSHVTM